MGRFWWAISGGALLVALFALLVPLFTGLSFFPAQSPSNTVSIGAILPVTGSGSWAGEAAKNGMLLATEDLNFKVQVLFEDSQNDPKMALSAMEKLQHQNQVKLFSTWLSVSSNALAPVAENNQTILMYGSATDSPAEKHSFVFKNHSDIEGDCQLLADYLQGKKGAGILANNDTSRICAEVFEKNGFFLDIEWFQKGETDFRTMLEKIKSKNPDFLLIRTNTIETRNLFRQIREMKVVSPFIVCPSLGTQDCDSEKVNADFSDLLKNAIGTDVYLHENERSNDFVQKYQDRFGSHPISDAAFGYEIVQMLFKAANPCNGKPDFSICVKKNLLSMEFEGIDGPIRFDTNGVIQRESYLLHFDENRWTKK